MFIWRKTSIAIVAIGAIAYANAAISGNIACNGVNAPTKAMTFSGPNFQAYCLPCIAALRTYGRVPVIDAITAAFETMNTVHPDTIFIYGEIGFPDGGEFKPHRTHRKGTSVDIMVPLKDGNKITTNMLNRFGYDVEFDESGRSEDGKIDFHALGDLILALRDEALARGGNIKIVILAPDLQPELEAAKPGITSQIRFNKNQAWVRHDDHIHVDFEFACNK